MSGRGELVLFLDFDGTVHHENMRWDPGRGLSLEAPVMAHAHGPARGQQHKIKLIKRQAFGYRDADCFFVKIRAAIPRKFVKNQKKATDAVAFLLNP